MHKMCNSSIRFKGIVGYSLKIIWLWLLLLFLFCGGLYTISEIDRNSVRPNAIESLKLLSIEGDHPRLSFGGPLLQKDNYTDAIMIGATICEYQNQSNWENVLNTPIISVDFSNDSPSRGTYQIAIKGVLENEDMSSYARYWHGYLMFLRPMLTIFSLYQLRLFNFVMLYSLAIITLILLYHKQGFIYTFFFLISLVCVAFPLVPQSLQYVTCFYITLFSCIIILSLKKKNLTTKSLGLLFFIIGGTTSFLDLLTTPLLTVGLPLSLALLCRNNLPDWKLVIVCGALWCLGYFGLWASKWIFIILFSTPDIIEDVIESIQTRTASIISLGMKIDSYHKILASLIFIIILSFIISIYVAIKKGYKTQVKKNATFAFLALTPAIWILAFQNHSFIHFWFVWRILAVTIFCFMIFYFNIIRKNEKHCCHNSLLQ